MILRGTLRSAWIARVLCGAALLLPATAHAQWKQWGGKNRDFYVAEGGLSMTWPQPGPKLRWEKPLGPGGASLLVDARMVFAIYRDGNEEVVAALDIWSGKTNWEHRYASPIPQGLGTPQELGPRATPVIAGVRIYTLGSLGHVHCLNINTGELLWKYDLVKELGLTPPKGGYTASVIGHMDRLIFTLGDDGAKKPAGMVVFHQRTGTFLWQKFEVEPVTATAAVLAVPPRDLLLLPTPKKLMSLEPLNGREQWDIAGDGFGTPVWDAHRDTLVVPSGKGCEGFTFTGVGEPQPKWSATGEPVRQALAADSLLLTAGAGESASICAYGLENGTKHWCEGGFHSPQMLYTGDRLIILDESGMLAIASVDAKQFTMGSKFKLEKTGSWGAPALETGKLLLRDSARAIVLELP